MVSPQPRRSSPAGQLQLVPSIEVVSPWAGAWREDGPVVGLWNPGDQTPLLNNSSPSSDAGLTFSILKYFPQPPLLQTESAMCPTSPW